ncbi:LRR receptor-like serine/threonine-protein kinase GHR1 [Linum grandiflorum]
MKLLRYLVLSLLFMSAMGQLPSQDILALLEFKKGIKHDPSGYLLQSWNEESIDFNGCPSSWNGIVCNGGNVAGVVLDNLDLSADADLTVFANLTMLVKLSMANNSITGQIPDNIGDFKTLEFLDLSNNLFNSSLPSGIGKLGSLRNLSLAGNNFSGPVPDSISGLASLQSLDLSKNSLSGAVPASLTRMDSLVYLDLSLNMFGKKIPRGFELILGLQVLDLHGNLLDGRLDGEFFLLTNASHVDFSGNLLGSSGSGKFLPGISDSIKYLNLSRNQLAGSLLSGGELRLFSSLKVLDLSYNQLSGELPGFDYAYELQVLKLGNNMFSGFVPNDLLKGDSLLLSELDLSANNLSGPITAIMSTTLHTLNLSSNGLKGDLPLLTGGCAVLDLSGNQFEGNLSRILKWGDVEYLDLSQNRLTGPLPEASSQLMRLNHLNLSYNSLTGSLPRSITQYPKMTVLDLSSNQFEGPLLSDLLTSPTLQELRLGHNSLSGDIEFVAPPNSKSDLQVLDLSHNRLNGYFPDRFGLLAGLHELNLAGNNISGSLPTSMAGMSSLTSLDLSQNHFTVSAEELVAAHKGSSSEILSPDEKLAAVTGGFSSPSKQSRYSWSPESGGESLARLDVRSPDRLVGELHFLDDTISLTPEELSRAPAEVLGRSSHGTSYRATLDNGVFLTVKWLREGVAKPKKDFAKEARKFTNIRHPNVVGLRGYYWGPTQHEKLILSDYISPGSLASFLFGKVSETIHPSSFLSFKYMLLMNNIKTNLNGLPTTRVIGMQWF